MNFIRGGKKKKNSTETLPLLPTLKSDSVNEEYQGSNGFYVTFLGMLSMKSSYMEGEGQYGTNI